MFCSHIVIDKCAQAPSCHLVDEEKQVFPIWNYFRKKIERNLDTKMFYQFSHFEQVFLIFLWENPSKNKAKNYYLFTQNNSRTVRIIGFFKTDIYPVEFKEYSNRFGLFYLDLKSRYFFNNSYQYFN